MFNKDKNRLIQVDEGTSSSTDLDINSSLSEASFAPYNPWYD